MIVRIALWRLDEKSPSLDEAAERLGVLVVADEDDPVPPQLEELRALVGRDPDLFEEFDAL